MTPAPLLVAFILGGRCFSPTGPGAPADAARPGIYDTVGALILLYTCVPFTTF
jgi:hypothetical protein